MTHKKLSYPPQAAAYLEEVRERRQVVLAQIVSLPIACLIWEPVSVDTPMSAIRRMLQNELIRNGHLADCNEEIGSPHLPFSPLAQRYANLEAYDLVFSVPDSASSVAEIRQIAKEVPHLGHKIVAYFDRVWAQDQGTLALVEFHASVSSQIVPYDEAQLPECIIDHALDCILRMQELQYIMMGRRI